MNTARHRDAVTRAKEARVAEHQRRRQLPFAQQPLRTVEIAQEQVEDACSLNQRRLEVIPLGGRHEQRNHVERPRPVNAFGIAVDVVGDAVVANRALGVLPPRRQLVTAERLERSHEGVVVRAEFAVRCDQLVVDEPIAHLVPIEQAPGRRWYRNACDRFHQRGSVAFGAITLCRAGRLKSSVNGKSGLRSSGGTVAAAGVCPPPVNRARRLLSAS